MKRRIFYITDALLNNSTAEAVHIDEICNYFSENGNDTTLYMPQSEKFRTKNNYQTHQIKSGKSSFYLIYFQIKLFLTLLFEKNNPDFYYCRHGLVLFVPVLVGKILKIPVFLEINGRLLQELPLLNKTLIVKFLIFIRALKLFEYLILYLSTGIVAMTSGLKEYIIATHNVFPQKISVIPSGVDTEQFKPSVKNNQDIVVGYLGSLHEWQGLRYIISAAKRVCEQLEGINFKIIGKGEDYQFLTTFIDNNNLSSRIKLEPAIPHSMVPSVISSFDICLCYPLSFRGGATSPFKVYEYLACGKAVLLADIGGLKEEFGESVYYVKPEAEEELVGAIILLSTNHTLREKLGIDGRRFVEEGHSWKAITEKILDFCQSQFNNSTSYASDNITC